MRITVFFGIELVVILRRKRPYRLIPYRDPNEPRTKEATKEKAFGKVLTRVFTPFDRETGKTLPWFSMPHIVFKDDETMTLGKRASYVHKMRKDLHKAVDWGCDTCIVFEAVK